ncbi:MAG TPA: DUF1415 domain-containing protein [Panacibacter sp.]|nr:DUF1415 domain-containing protein [Panacibacter sp.]HNP43637.1 DUF1415 domain-containing protein [Panacibacter sp.]
MLTPEKVVEQTEKWILDVVVGLNFCPFASNVVKQQKIFYRVEMSSELHTCLNTVLQELLRLDDNAGIETSFVIFPNAFENFNDYLDMVWLAEKQLKKQGYKGVYQLASFHPQYLFAKSKEEDAANYTNRSVYPMIHLLRESSIDKALQHFKSPGNIPERNISFAREKGPAYMRMLRDACLDS